MLFSGSTPAKDSIGNLFYRREKRKYPHRRNLKKVIYLKGVVLLELRIINQYINRYIKVLLQELVGNGNQYSCLLTILDFFSKSLNSAVSLLNSFFCFLMN